MRERLLEIDHGVPERLTSGEATREVRRQPQALAAAAVRPHRCADEDSPKVRLQTSHALQAPIRVRSFATRVVYIDGACPRDAP
jgi:hypothetical protein